MSKDICKIFGKKLKNIRLDKGLTQETLGFEVNLAKNTISQYESGKKTPSLRTAGKIANALGVKLSEMLD